MKHVYIDLQKQKTHVGIELCIQEYNTINNTKRSHRKYNDLKHNAITSNYHSHNTHSPREPQSIAACFASSFLHCRLYLRSLLPYPDSSSFNVRQSRKKKKAAFDPFSVHMLEAVETEQASSRFLCFFVLHRQLHPYLHLPGSPIIPIMYTGVKKQTMIGWSTVTCLSRQTTPGVTKSRSTPVSS